MGCAASGDASQMTRLVLELEDSKNKASETQNLLRFKIEILVNMLAVEEKKNESSTKRLETLKWLLHSQGVAEQTLTNILINAENCDEENRSNMMGSVERNISFRHVGLVDLAGAISRGREEFELYRTEIFPAFAEEDGKIVTTLTNDEFMKQLYTVTEKLSKADIQILALRFGDGSGFVSIPEFLEFFTTPAQMRMAKAATAAVRMSLDMLHLDLDGIEEEYNDDADGNNDNDDIFNQSIDGSFLPLATHLTSNLDRGVKRLLLMWVQVKKELEVTFVALTELEDMVEETQQIRDQQVVEVDIFKGVLLDKCSIRSSVLKQAEQGGHIRLINKNIAVNTAAITTAAEAAAEKKQTAATTSNNTEAKGNNSKVTTEKATTTTTTAEGGVGDAAASMKGSLFPTNSTTQVLSLSSASATTAVIIPSIEPLDSDDIDLLTERFELGGFVHYGHFLQYFRELHYTVCVNKRRRAKQLLNNEKSKLLDSKDGNTNNNNSSNNMNSTVAAEGTTLDGKQDDVLIQSAISSASPFRMSSEWQALKASTVLKQYATTTAAAGKSDKLPLPPATTTAKSGKNMSDANDNNNKSIMNKKKSDRISSDSLPTSADAMAGEGDEGDTNKGKNINKNSSSNEKDVAGKDLAATSLSADEKTSSNSNIGDDNKDKEKTSGDKKETKSDSNADTSASVPPAVTKSTGGGFLCCGSAASAGATLSQNKPEVLPNPTANSTTSATTDDAAAAESKENADASRDNKNDEKKVKGNDSQAPGRMRRRFSRSDSDEEEEEEEKNNVGGDGGGKNSGIVAFNPKFDRGFNTPIDKTKSKKTGFTANAGAVDALQFKPRTNRQTRDTDEDDDDDEVLVPAREGLGRKDSHNTSNNSHSNSNAAVPRSKFIRRTPSAAAAGGSSTNYDEENHDNNSSSSSSIGNNNNNIRGREERDRNVKFSEPRSKRSSYDMGDAEDNYISNTVSQSRLQQRRRRDDDEDEEDDNIDNIDENHLSNNSSNNREQGRLNNQQKATTVETRWK